MQYSPVLPMRHTWVLTAGHTVQGARMALSMPSQFESTTLIALFGEGGARAACHRAPLPRRAHQWLMLRAAAHPRHARALLRTHSHPHARVCARTTHPP